MFYVSTFLSNSQRDKKSAEKHRNDCLGTENKANCGTISYITNIDTSDNLSKSPSSHTASTTSSNNPDASTTTSKSFTYKDSESKFADISRRIIFKHNNADLDDSSYFAKSASASGGINTFGNVVIASPHISTMDRVVVPLANNSKSVQTSDVRNNSRNMHDNNNPSRYSSMNDIKINTSRSRPLKVPPKVPPKPGSGRRPSSNRLMYENKVRF